MCRGARFRQADLVRALKGAQKAELSIAYVRIEPDGTILIVPGAPEQMSHSVPNPWDT